MKKTLVAIAALAAFGAQAQSTVTLTGNLDFAYASITGTQYQSNAKTFTTGNGTSSTSVINLDAIEDLGNGAKAQVHYGIDPRTLANDGLGYTAYGQSTAQVNTVTGLGRDELYVGLSGNYGNLRLGSPNSIGLNTFQQASPLGTGVGSGYAPNASTVMNSVINTRYNRSMRFDSPTIAGFTASVLYAPGGDLATDSTVSSTSGLNQVNAVPNARKTTEVGLKYSNGPFNVAVASIKQDAQTNALGWYSNAVGLATGGADSTSATIYGANYTYGSTTLYVGGNSGNRLASGYSQAATTSTAAVDSKGHIYAVKQNLGQVDLIAQYTSQETTTSKNVVKGLRADYNMSKTAAVYVGYENWDTGLDANANSVTGKGTRKIASAGLRKSF